jgi:polysaccharide export outer membrane protein
MRFVASLVLVATAVSPATAQSTQYRSAYAANDARRLPTVDGPVAFAPLGDALFGGSIQPPISEGPEVFRSLFVAAAEETRTGTAPRGIVQNASGHADTLMAAVPAGYETAAPTVSFRKPERPDLFAPQTESAKASGPITGQPAPAAHIAGNDLSSPLAAASGNVLRSGSNPPDSVSQPDPAATISEFRFVNVAEDTFQSQSPSDTPNNTEKSQPVGDAAARFMSSTLETGALGEAQHASLPACAEEATGKSPNEPAIIATEGALPAGMTSTFGEPLPIIGDATFVSPLPGEVGNPNRVYDGCPYLPGHSGTTSVCGIDCGQAGAPCCATWNEAQCIPWSLFGPGEYAGPARPQHVSAYYLRVNDLITLTYIASRRKEAQAYRIGVGDKFKIEWLQPPSTTDATLDREVLVSPDGTMTLPLVGDVIAAGKTVQDLRNELIELYSRYQREPQITVTPIEVNTAVQDIINSITSISGSNGQTQALRVTPEGTIQAPGLGSVYVQGLTIEEARAELEARYAAKIGPGLMVSPSLTERAASFVFIGGEVQAPGRYPLEGPTTVMQAITLAGGWNNGGNLRQVVIFRRDENWCLKATKIDIHNPLFGKDPCPTNDVWLRDNDLVIVPKTRILCATDVINLYFTRGVYAVFPINYVYDFSNGGSVTPIVTPGP